MTRCHHAGTIVEAGLGYSKPLGGKIFEFPRELTDIMSHKYDEEGVAIGDDVVKDKSVDDLIKAITDCKGDFAFLIGAGTSKPAGIPTGGDLIEEWREEAYKSEDSNQSKNKWVDKKEKEMKEYQSKYGFWFEQIYTTKKQRRQYIENEVVNGATPQFSHVVLASMMAERHGERFVPMTMTPNFDDLLYDAFYHFIERRPLLVNHNALASQFTLTENTPTIVKVHGDYLYENIKNLDNETDNLEAAIEDVLIQAIGEYGLVVVGYGGKDESIMEPIIEANRSDAGVFWCIRSEDNLSDYAKELLHQPNTFRVEIDGSNELFSKIFTQIDDLSTPSRKEIVERATERADELQKKKTEAERYAPEGEYEKFRIDEQIDKALSRYYNGDVEKAKEEFENIFEKEWGEDESIQLSRAHYVYGAHILEDELDRRKEAMGHYEDAIELDPENSKAHNNYGAALWKENQQEEAEYHLREAIEANPKNATAHMNYAKILFESDRFEKAREHLQKAIELNPNSPQPLNHYAKVMWQGYNNPVEAEELLREAIELDPENPNSHNSYAKLLFEELDRPEEAKEHLEKAIELDPELPYPHRHYGNLLWKELNKPEEAKEHLEKAIELDPEYTNAHRDYAELLEELDQFEEAEEHRRRVDEIESDDNEKQSTN
jgi:Tfp pilus assembly protein PilF